MLNRVFSHLTPQAVDLLRGSTRGPSMRTPARGPSLCLAAILLLVVAAPMASATGARSVDVSLSADSTAKDASPGEPAEYTIRVRNTGDEDITVQLSTSQEAGGCQGYTSAIEQVPGTISANSFEDVILTVNVTDDTAEQVADDCDTTVNANANPAEPLSTSPPTQADITVTTSKSEGSGNALYGVELSTNTATKNYNGQETVEFIVNVKNSGQSQASISLEMTDSSSCRSDGLNPSIDPTTMTLQSDDEEEATVSIPVPDGEQTEAGSHCFIVRATVTNDPNQQNQAQDNLSLTLNIPELHECEASVSPQSMTLSPGESETGTLSLSNAGNSDWTVTFGKSGEKASWVNPSQSTSLLEYDNGNGETSFSFTIQADDSLSAGSTTSILIRGLDGNSMRCEDTIQITVGQSYAVSASLSSNNLHQIDPGTSDSTQLTVTNNGNGQDTFSISHSPVPSGWTITLEESTVSLEGKQASNSARQTSVEVTVSVPTDALADEAEEITITVTSLGSSSASASDNLDVTVAERHALIGEVLSVDQTGRSDENILFPLTITNDGNVQDSFRLRACDPSQGAGGSCASPTWSSRYVDSTGQVLTQISLNAGESQQVYLEVEIPAEGNVEEGDYLQIEIRVNILSAPSNEFSKVVTARVSNFDYLMQLILSNPQGAPDSMSMKLPPGGEFTVLMTLTNVGNSYFTENALFTVNGLESTISRELSVNGLDVEIATQPYEIGQTNASASVEVTFKVLPGVPNGEGGVVNVCAASMRNTATPSCVAVVITVETVHDLSVEVVDGPERNISFTSGELNYADFYVEITNSGNVEEEVVVSSTEGLRGWTVDIDVSQDGFKLEPGTSRTIQVRVKPPVEMSFSDEFEFTLIVTPESAPVAAQPIDMKVNADLEESMFGLSSETWNMVTWGVLGVIAIAILILVFSNRRRSQLI